MFVKKDLSIKYFLVCFFMVDINCIRLGCFLIFSYVFFDFMVGFFNLLVQKMEFIKLINFQLYQIKVFFEFYKNIFSLVYIMFV